MSDDLSDCHYRVSFRIETPDGENTEENVEYTLRIVDCNGRFFASHPFDHWQGQGTSPTLAILDYLKTKLGHKDT